MSVNKVILIGNLGADPESRAFPDGGSICNISLATSENWKDKQTGERQERTEWHRVVLRNRLGEIAQQYLHKGSKVYIEGRIHTRKWQDQQGQDRYSTEVVAQNMTMLDAKGDNAPAASNYQSGAQPPAGQPAGGAPNNNQTAQPQNAPEPDYLDDDIPF